jgi:hypothetical protein
MAAANRSTLLPSYYYLKLISGAIYPSVPNVVLSLPSLYLSNIVAKPKSATFKLKSPSKSKFSGFKSLCAIPFEWRYCKDPISCLK